MAGTGRIDGALDEREISPVAIASGGPAVTPSLAAQPGGQSQGDVSLDFADTDIRVVVQQILGTILRQNYTMDPSVQGNVTLRTTVKLPRTALIPTLQTLLAQNGAVLVRNNGFYSVMPSAEAAASPSPAEDHALGGADMVALRYVDAARLTQMLARYITSSARITPVADQNALIVSGDPSSRDALVALIEAFDVDKLAGQSYELFPVTGGDAQDFSAAFSAALGTSADANRAGPITVVPLERINAVLVIARTETLLADARRVYAVLGQVERETVRSWHVYYLHNGRAGDAAIVLQKAFPPHDVTASAAPQANAEAGTDAASSASTPDQNNDADQIATAGATAPPDGLRIITDNQNNALLVYATGAEDTRITGMLDRIDIPPEQVRIDAVIAEVDLDNALQYGTQFYFKSGGINAVLSGGASAALATSFPGFVLSGYGANAAPLAISALQSVTKVNVLSSPQLLVLDGQAASLQVGDSVPYLTQASQATQIAGSPVVNSIAYHETGVILQITPHIGSTGVVTLDVAQEVGAVQPAAATAGIGSPVFSQRAVTSRVAIQDGQTIGFAGLISDSDSHQNQGIPYLKNVPLLGALFGTQNNQRTRTELLLLITPHVVRTPSDETALTADLRAAIPGAAGVPAALARLPASNSADPDEAARSRLVQ
jgi:general secretion pathway protein D